MGKRRESVMGVYSRRQWPCAPQLCKCGNNRNLHRTDVQGTQSDGCCGQSTHLYVSLNFGNTLSPRLQTMFRSATTRIAHNSIVPGLAVVNKDLKALQDLINAEKTVLQG